MPTAGENPQPEPSVPAPINPALADKLQAASAELAAAAPQLSALAVNMPTFGRFALKPRTIDARRLTETNAREISNWVAMKGGRCDITRDNASAKTTLSVGGQLGPRSPVSIGEWILCPKPGEFYAMSNGAFLASHEIVTFEEADKRRPLTEAELAEIKTNKELRRDLDAQLQKLRALKPSRERSISITKLQESILWLGMDLKRLNDERPYPSSYDPTSSKIEPTADGLKL